MRWVSDSRDAILVSEVNHVDILEAEAAVTAAEDALRATLTGEGVVALSRAVAMLARLRLSRALDVPV